MRPRTYRKENAIIHIEQSVTIQRPLKEVFTFLTDVENWGRLQSVSGETIEPASRGPMKVGDTFRQTLEISGQRVELLCKVVELEENERLAFEYTWDQLFLWIGLVFEPFDGGTRLATGGEGRLGGFMALFEPLVANEVDAQLITKLDEIKNLLES